VVAGAGWWWSGREGTVAGERVAGERVAVLVTAGGQRLVVGGEKAGVVWSGDGVMAAVDSGRALSYKAGGEERRVEGEHALLVPRGGEYRLALEDGTRVALNAESRLRFPASFSGRATRRVVLEGEGYFEVAAMDGKLFVVESGCAEVTALGTSFNVNERGEGGRVEATVVEGSVRVAAANGAVEVVLRPGEQASAGADGIATREVDAGMVVGWTTGCFRFDGATLEVIAGQLERWYDARFCFAREELKGLRFTGAIRRGYSLEEAAGLLARTTRARVEVRGDSVVVE
jgi:ferric-dicitrate binding protein FerR (iron transport regulator)